MNYTIRKNRVVEVYLDGKFVKAFVSERAAKKWIANQDDSDHEQELAGIKSVAHLM